MHGSRAYDAARTAEVQEIPGNGGVRFIIETLTPRRDVYKVDERNRHPCRVARHHPADPTSIILRRVSGVLGCVERLGPRDSSLGMAKLPPLSAVLVGRTDAHLSTSDDAGIAGFRLHAGVLADFLALREAAAGAGFDLRVHSAFRDFERQRSIWNRKATGSLAVLDSEARPLDIARLRPAELVLAIMRWSALPGASRHHWGTDLDVYDAATTPPGHEIQLVPAEVDPGGMHGALHEWLDARITSGNAWGFYRPYDRDRGGVAPERWHLSHAPIASEYLAALTPALLRQTIETGELQLAGAVLDMLDDLYLRFVININPPPSPLRTRPVVA